MAWRFHGRAKVNSRFPQAAAICDRCGFCYTLADLHFQYQWAGPHLQNLRLLVCDRCLDVPQPQLKPRFLPPDPVPVFNARPENYLVDDFDFQVTQDDDILVTEDDDPTVSQNVANNREDAP